MSILLEHKGNVFDHVNENVYLAHCISADYALGAGIAKEIELRYGVRFWLNNLNRHIYLDCISVKNILNIVTKEHYWDKPTYESFTNGIIATRMVCDKIGVKHIVMPRIGWNGINASRL